MNDINEYQEWTRIHWKKDDEPQDRIIHAVLGLAGESGEVVDLVKKGFFTPSRLPDYFVYRQELVKELGDVLYYLCRIADEYEIPMSTVIEANMYKLDERFSHQAETNEVK